MLLRSIYIAAISCIVAVNAATYPDAYITGPQTIQNSTYIPTGFYSFRNHVTGQWLEFIADENQVQPSNGQNSTAFNGTLWTVKYHAAKNYSIHHLNGQDSSSGNDKCISTRWDDQIGIDDAAVMWQCEVDNITATPLDFNINPSFSGVYDPNLGLQPLQRRGDRFFRRFVNTYTPIRPDKQQWMFIPQTVSATPPSWKNVTFNTSTGNNTWQGPKIKPDLAANENYGQNSFYIVSAAHLWNMYPRCLYPLPMNVFNFTSNNTVVTALEDCQYGNETMLWDLVLWEAENFPQGDAAPPDVTPHSNGSTLAFLSSVPTLSFLVLMHALYHWITL
ncbi:unnamed protein product [Umbelopsis ramanniana]